MELPFPILTSPMTLALGATKTLSSESLGLAPAYGANVCALFTAKKILKR
jgi:hypothetical protein